MKSDLVNMHKTQGSFFLKKGLNSLEIENKLDHGDDGKYDGTMSPLSVKSNSQSMKSGISLYHKNEMLRLK